MAKQNYKEFIVYYFSGTGNAKNVALWLQEIAQNNKITSQIINIAYKKDIVIAPTNDILYAFVSPVHGFNYPPVMLHFIMRLTKGNADVLLLNTRAGMLINRFITPGVSGITFYLATLILLIKGYKVKGFLPVDLPSNWISLHPALNKRTSSYLYEKNKIKITNNFEKILNGNTNFKAIREIIQDIIVTPIAPLYYFVGRFAIAKTFFASNDCNNCNLCIKECPTNSIIKINNRPFWTFTCESCMRCMNRCPKRAIETGHSFISIVIITYTILITYVLYYLNSFVNIKTDNIIVFILKPVVFLLLIGLSYRIMHYLLKFKFFERIMVYTSLTQYKFWGRYNRNL